MTLRAGCSGVLPGTTKVVVGEIFNFEGRAPDLFAGVRHQALPQRHDLGLSPQLPPSQPQ